MWGGGGGGGVGGRIKFDRVVSLESILINSLRCQQVHSTPSDMSKSQSRPRPDAAFCGV